MAKQNHAATLPDAPAPARQAVIASLLKTDLLAGKPAPAEEDVPDPSVAQPVPTVTGTELGDAESAHPSTHARGGLRAAAQAVVVAWDAQGRPDMLAAVMEQLRAALARKPALTSASGPRTRCTDTKQATVLALLRRPEGATVAQVVEATGWAPHIVRGFLAGLKRRGIPVEVLERIRQVGPGRAGAKGSYSVYRVAEAG